MKAATTRGFLDRAEELALVQAIRAGDPDAMDRLLRAHSPLVRGLARRYAVGGISRDDLEQEGSLGLLVAAGRYDPSRANRFATYARWWVRHRMQVHVGALRRIVPMPKSREMRKARARMGRARGRLEQELGGPVSDRLLAEAIGVAEETVREARSGLYGRDLPVVGERVRGGFLPRSPDGDPEDQAARGERRILAARLVESGLSALDDRETMIVRRRRLSDEAPTLRELGKEFGVSGERVRQLEKRALEKLRAVLERTDRATARACAAQAT